MNFSHILSHQICLFPPLTLILLGFFNFKKGLALLLNIALSFDSTSGGNGFCASSRAHRRLEKKQKQDKAYLLQDRWRQKLKSSAYLEKRYCIGNSSESCFTIMAQS